MIKLRPEALDDIAEIGLLTDAAFAGMPHASGNESRITDALRACGALTVSQVAVLDGRIVGHAAASAVAIDGADLGWHGLGPVAVVPGHQGRGVGSALVRDVLNALRAIRSRGCVVLGDPSYYERFGFGVIDGLVYPAAPAAYFRAHAFGDCVPRGRVAYHPAFNA